MGLIYAFLHVLLFGVSKLALSRMGLRVFFQKKKVGVCVSRRKREGRKTNLFLFFSVRFLVLILGFAPPFRRVPRCCCCFSAVIPAESRTRARSLCLPPSLPLSLSFSKATLLLLSSLALAQLLAQPLLLRLGEPGAVLVPRRGGDGGSGSRRSRRPRGGRRGSGDGARRRRSGGGGGASPVGVGSGARRRHRGAEELCRDLAIDRPLCRGRASSSPAAAAARRVASSSSSSAASSSSSSAAARDTVAVAPAAAAAAGLRVVVPGRRRCGRDSGHDARLESRHVSVLVGEVEML